MKVKQAQSITIQRSQINFASYNPRRLSDTAKKKLKANLKRIGLAGGIVWNETTGNLVSGHQRLSIIDEIEKYNPDTHENDYPIRVEVLKLSDKEEKEQNIFFNSTTAQGEFDNDLLAALIPEIDYDLAGLDEADINVLIADVPVFDVADYNQAVKDDFRNLEQITDEERLARKEAVKQAKQATKNNLSEEVTGDPYITLSFYDYESKLYFMEVLKNKIEEAKIIYSVRPDDKYIKGEIVQQIIENS